MKNDIHASCVEIPVPIDVYVGLLNHLKRNEMDCGPASLVASIVRRYLDDDTGKRSSALDEPAPDWSNDWLMFGEPPAVERGKAPGLVKDTETSQDNDWCIGCSCPSEDLLSS